MRIVNTRRGSIKCRPLIIFLAMLGLIVSLRLEGPLWGDGAALPHVLVISVDGMAASVYAKPWAGVRIPNLLRLKKEGSFAEGVVGVYPTVTYPAHTTLVTGCVPAEHGVYSNLSSREAGKNSHDWFWFSKAIKVPTLWNEARSAGMTSGAIAWPVTVGAPVDWNIPEIWDPQKGDVGDFGYIAKFMDPGLAGEVEQVLGGIGPGADTDVVRTRLAAYLIKKHRPNLFLVHLAEPDNDEHQHGPQSAEARSALERVDARIEELLGAMREAGVEDSTDVFIVSDHGFLPIEREIRPNVLLVKAGLLEADGQGAVTGGKLATVSNGGSFFIYWLPSMDLRAEVDRALQPLRSAGVLWGVVDSQGLRDIGAEPAAQLALEAPEGATFSSAAGGELISPMTRPGGTHGYLPFRAGLEASFIAWGPRIKGGMNLHRIPMTAIGPTILKDLGINDPRFGDGSPPLDILK